MLPTYLRVRRTARASRLSHAPVGGTVDTAALPRWGGTTQRDAIPQGSRLSNGPYFGKNSYTDSDQKMTKFMSIFG